MKDVIVYVVLKRKIFLKVQDCFLLNYETKKMTDLKYVAFLLDCPKKGSTMMFPDYYENMQQEIDESYEETSKEDLLGLRYSANIANDKFIKVFRKKIVKLLTTSI